MSVYLLFKFPVFWAVHWKKKKLDYSCTDTFAKEFLL